MARIHLALDTQKVWSIEIRHATFDDNGCRCIWIATDVATVPTCLHGNGLVVLILENPSIKCKKDNKSVHYMAKCCCCLFWPVCISSPCWYSNCSFIAHVYVCMCVLSRPNHRVYSKENERNNKKERKKGYENNVFCIEDVVRFYTKLYLNCQHFWHYKIRLYA